MQAHQNIQHVASHYSTTQTFCQDLIPKLQAILNSLMADKEAFEYRTEQEKNCLKEEIQNKDNMLNQLRQENAMLKQQIRNLCHERDQKRTLIDFFKKKTNQQQAQIDSLGSIIRYLQIKNKQLNQEIFQTRKAMTTRQVDNSKRNPRTSMNFLPPEFLMEGIEKDSLYEYTDFLEKDLPKVECCRTQSYPISQQLIKFAEDEMTTVQNTSSRKQSVPVVLSGKKGVVSMDNSGRMLKATKTSKRCSMGKSQVNLTRLSKKTLKARGQMKILGHKSQANLLKYMKE